MSRNEVIEKMSEIISRTDQNAIETVGARASAKMIAETLYDLGIRPAAVVINEFAERIIRYYNVVGGNTNAALTAYTVKQMAEEFLKNLRGEQL